MMDYKLQIRPLEEGDSDISYTWRNDPEVWLFTGQRPNIVVTKEIEKEWIKRVIKEDNSMRYAIIADNNYIGNVQITDIDYTSKKAEFHIFIGNKSYWGKGIGSKATKMFVSEVKTKTSLKEIYLTVLPENVAAIHIYKKIGFTFDPVEENKMSLSL